MNKEQKEEYDQKRNHLLSERDSKIKQLETKMEKEYYQKIEQCKNDIYNNPKKVILKKKLLDRRKDIESHKKVSFEQDQRIYQEIKNLSDNLKEEYHCNVDPLQIVDFEIFQDEHNEQRQTLIKNDFKRKIDDEKKKRVKPIVTEYLKKFNELDKEYKSEEPEIRFVPIRQLPPEAYKKQKKTTKRTSKK